MCSCAARNRVRCVKLNCDYTFILSIWCFEHSIVRDLIGPKTWTSGRSPSFCHLRIPRKTLGRNLNKSFTVEEPTTIGRAEHENDLALNADVTNFLGCPHNLPFKSSPIAVQKTLADAPNSSDRHQINGTLRSDLSAKTYSSLRKII